MNIAGRCLLIGLEQAVKILDACKKKWVVSKRKFTVGPSITY